MRSLATALLIIAATWPEVASAQIFSSTFFGHDFYFTEEGIEDVLKIDGQEVLRDGQIHLREVGLIGAQPYLLGSAGPGGNLCANRPFLISFQQSAPAVDVFPEECISPPHQASGEGISFVIPGNAIADARAWLWTPEVGFTKAEAPARPLESGWEAFRSRQITAPSDFITYSDLTDIMKARAGSGWQDLLSSIYGPPDGFYEGNFFVGENCIAHNCPFGGTFVVADLRDQEIYVAWRLDDQITVRPSAADWPEAMQYHLNRWLEK